MNFIDLESQYRRIKPEIAARINKVLKHGHFVMGPEVEELEIKLATFAGTQQCVSCASGTDALVMILMAEGIGPGDAVFVPAFTFFASAEAVALVGATPVFVDIDPATYCIDPSALAGAIASCLDGKRTAPGAPEKLVPRAVIAVDLYGLAADYGSISKICRRHKLFLLEDGAQSFGATSQGKRCGSFGDCAVTSFYPAKPLGGYGEGGAIFAESTEFAAKLRSLRNHGSGAFAYDHVRIGLNGRLDTFQAAIVLAKLEIFESELAQRQAVANRYRSSLNGCCTLQIIPAGYQSSWAQFTIEVENRDSFRASLTAQGIPTAVHYPRPVHLQPAFGFLAYQPGSLPVSERASQRVVSLPMHPYLDTATVDAIAEAVKRCVVDK